MSIPSGHLRKLPIVLILVIHHQFIIPIIPIIPIILIILIILIIPIIPIIPIILIIPTILIIRISNIIITTTTITMITVMRWNPNSCTELHRRHLVLLAMCGWDRVIICE
jgi:hypothetical protein